MFGTTNTGFPGATNFTNVSVTFSLQSTPDFADCPYRATYTNTAVTSTAYASVTYSNEQASSGNFASICQTFDGGIYLYAKTNVGTVTIPTISVGFYSSGLNIDNTVTAGSQALITSGAVATAIASIMSQNISYTDGEAEIDSYNYANCVKIGGLKIQWVSGWLYRNNTRRAPYINFPEAFINSGYAIVATLDDRADHALWSYQVRVRKLSNTQCRIWLDKGDGGDPTQDCAFSLVAIGL